MSDKGTQGTSEQEDNLFDTEDSDASADGESNSSEQESDSDTEEIKETDELDLEEDKNVNLSKSEKERQKQIDVWHRRVTSGEVELNDLPKDLKWLKPHILERLDAEKKTPDIERLVEQKFAEKEDKAKFVSLKETLKHAKLTKAQQKDLQNEFKDLRKDGLQPSKALMKAMRIVGVELETAPDELRKAMKLPPSGGRVTDTPKVLDPNAFSTVPEKERIKELERLRMDR